MKATTREPHTGIKNTMETKLHDEGMLTFEDRYENIPAYKHIETDLEDELAWAQVQEISCNCPRLGMFGQHHYDTCPKFEDNSH